MKNIDNIVELRKDLVGYNYEKSCRLILEATVNSKGSFLEFGVAGGNSLRVIAEMAPERIFYGFDSFQGLPEKWSRTDIDAPAGFFACDVPQMPENVILYVGLFEETLPVFVDIHKENVAFMNVDCDLYSSTKTIFKHLGNQIVPGTIIRFDEIYQYKGWEDHEYKAFKEFLDEKNYDCEFLFQDGSEQLTVRVIGL